MTEEMSFGQRLGRELLPTLGQALVALLLAMMVFAAAQSTALMSRLGITEAGVNASQSSLLTPLRWVLISPITSNLVLIVFWATVGLIAYLICWSFYNFLIEARNEVTLETAYTNRGHWRGPWQTLILKLVCGAGLVATLATLHLTIPAWLALGHPIFESATLASVGIAAVAVFGIAANLYLVLFFVQLTFTPWYRVKSFT